MPASSRFSSSNCHLTALLACNKPRALHRAQSWLLPLLEQGPGSCKRCHASYLVRLAKGLDSRPWQVLTSLPAACRQPALCTARSRGPAAASAAFTQAWQHSPSALYLASQATCACRQPARGGGLAAASAAVRARWHGSAAPQRPSAPGFFCTVGRPGQLPHVPGDVQHAGREEHTADLCRRQARPLFQECRKLISGACCAYLQNFEKLSAATPSKHRYWSCTHRRASA